MALEKYEDAEKVASEGLKVRLLMNF